MERTVESRLTALRIDGGALWADEASESSRPDYRTTSMLSHAASKSDLMTSLLLRHVCRGGCLPWRSSQGGLFDARIRADIRLRRATEGGALVDAVGNLIGMAVFGPRGRGPRHPPCHRYAALGCSFVAPGRVRHVRLFIKWTGDAHTRSLCSSPTLSPCQFIQFGGRRHDSMEKTMIDATRKPPNSTPKHYRVMQHKALTGTALTLFVLGGAAIGGYVMSPWQPARANAATVSAAASDQTATPVAPVANTSGYANGTFTGPVTDAYYGSVQIQAIVQSGRLTGIKVLQYPSDRRTSIVINSQALPMLRDEVVAAQSAKVDIISGATLTSEAFIQSLGGALKQAIS